MIWRFFQYVFYMSSVVMTFMKDVLWEELTLDEIRNNYLFGKANAYDRANLLRRAVKVYEQVLRRDPNNVAVFLNLGGLYYRRDMFEKAIPFYERVIALNPKHYHGHYWLAMCYWKLQRYCHRRPRKFPILFPRLTLKKKGTDDHFPSHSKRVTRYFGLEIRGRF
jgi:tetratricopeptide (TPR) repeat protein